MGSISPVVSVLCRGKRRRRSRAFGCIAKASTGRLATSSPNCLKAMSQRGGRYYAIHTGNEVYSTLFTPRTENRTARTGNRRSQTAKCWPARLPGWGCGVHSSAQAESIGADCCRDCPVEERGQTITSQCSLKDSVGKGLFEVRTNLPDAMF